MFTYDIEFLWDGGSGSGRGAVSSQVFYRMPQIFNNNPGEH